MGATSATLSGWRLSQAFAMGPRLNSSPEPPPPAPATAARATHQLQRRWRRRGPSRPASLSFMGSLDMPELVPAWLMPSWMLPTTPADKGEKAEEETESSSRAGVRRRRLTQLRQQLAAASIAPALPLPLAAEDQPGGSGGADDCIDVAHSTSNAVPFCAPPSSSGGQTPASAAGAACGSTCRAEEAKQVFPWLYAVSGRLDFTALETLASQLALSGLQLLDVSRYAAAAASQSNTLPSNIRWAGPQAFPSPPVAAAAALRRMELRRGGVLRGMDEVEGKAVVLSYHPQHRQLAAETLALYLHAYLGVSAKEAVQAAGHAVGASPLQSSLRHMLEELATLADGWQRRVTLAWPYAGAQVEIVGDAVGGWEQRAPMFYDVLQHRWRLQIWGLPPGVHRFKYLVDGGCWVVDLAAHTEADSRGNINNVVLVAGPGTQQVHGVCAAAAAISSIVPSSSGSAAPVAAAAVAAGGGDGMQAGVLATVQPPVLLPRVQPVANKEGAATDDVDDEVEVEQEEGGSVVDQQQQQQAWRSEEEMERMARFGAALLAYHTRMGVQLRHMLH